jgi:hypothetical protein
VTSEWKPGNESVALSSAIAGRTMNFDWEKAQWNKKVDKSSVAFAKAVTFSKELSNNLVYKTP